MNQLHQESYIRSKIIVMIDERILLTHEDFENLTTDFLESVETVSIFHKVDIKTTFRHSEKSKWTTYFTMSSGNTYKDEVIPTDILITKLLSFKL
jgi:hypothetical protein